MSLIDEALSANATIANGYDPGRGKPPAPKIAIFSLPPPEAAGQGLRLAPGDVLALSFVRLAARRIVRICRRARNLLGYRLVAARCGRTRRWRTWQWCTAARWW